MRVTTDEMKKQTYILIDHFRQEYQNTEFYLCDAYDVIAKIHGYKDWDQALKILDEE